MAILVGTCLRQSEDSTGPGVEADAGFGQAELGVVGGYDDVAGHGYFKSTAEGVSVDGGDNGLPALEIGCYPTERELDGH